MYVLYIIHIYYTIYLFISPWELNKLNKERDYNKIEHYYIIHYLFHDLFYEKT